MHKCVTRPQGVNSLWPSDAIRLLELGQHWLGLLPEGIKPLTKPMLTHQQWLSPDSNFTWGTWAQDCRNSYLAWGLILGLILINPIYIHMGTNFTIDQCSLKLTLINGIIDERNYTLLVKNFVVENNDLIFYGVIRMGLTRTSPWSPPLSAALPQPSITKIALNINYLTIHLNLPRANDLKHWVLNKIVNILYTTYWNVFSGTKYFHFDPNLYWSLLIREPLSIKVALP